MQNGFIKQDAESSLHHSLLSLARVLLRSCLPSARLSVHRGSRQYCFLNSGSNDGIPQLRHPPCNRGRRSRLGTTCKFTKETGLKTLRKIAWHVVLGWLPLGGASGIINKIIQYQRNKIIQYQRNKIIQYQISLNKNSFIS